MASNESNDLVRAVLSRPNPIDPNLCDRPIRATRSPNVVAAGASTPTLASTVTNENGEYFITLKGGVTYSIKVVKKGYKTTTETVELKIGKTEPFSLEKQIMLNKEK